MRTQSLTISPQQLNTRTQRLAQESNSASFNAPPFTLLPVHLNLCVKIGELISQANFHPTNINPQLHREINIRTIRSSLMIEGNPLNQAEVSAILDGKPVIGNFRHITEVQNAFEIYQKLPELRADDIDHLLIAHKTMMQNLLPDAGKFRTGNVGVFAGETLIHAGTPPKLIPQAINNLFTWIKNNSLHPLITSSIFHYEFEFIHPFSDGNGRIGRLWQTLLLGSWRKIFFQFPIESTIANRQDLYYKAIESANLAGDSAEFVTFMLETIHYSLQQALNLVSGKKDFSHDILLYLSKHPEAKISEVAQELGAAKRTIERIIAQLQKEGKLIRHGSPRKSSWEVANVNKTQAKAF